MTIKVVKPCVAADGRTGPNTGTLVVRLTAMRKRSQQLLHDMTQLEEDFRQHFAARGHTPAADPSPES
jgi:hypothetical protein